jgi:hypothetical protein
MRNFAYSANDFAAPTLGQPLGESAISNKTIPFDYAFQFPLQGIPGNKVQDVVEISVEGVFVALAVGYSLLANEQKIGRTFRPVLDQKTIPLNPAIVPVLTADGNDDVVVRRLEGLFIAGAPDAEIALLEFNESPPAFSFRTLPTKQKFGRLRRDGTVKIDFTPALDLGSFRVWDRTNNLFSDLFDFRIGSATAMIGPNPSQKLPAAGDEKVFVYGLPGDEIGIFLLEGATGQILEVKNAGSDGFSDFTLDKDKIFDKITGRAVVPLKVRVRASEILINKKLASGDTLIVRRNDVVQNIFTVPPLRPSAITLGAVAAGLEKAGSDLTTGFRLSANFANLADADLPLDQLASGKIERIFETGSVAAEEVSFLYNIDVTGTGREYQNKPIHNIAGLGIANGDRPFRPFAKPIAFEPRASIRIQVEELSGPAGTLFIVLQGYKMLGATRLL